MSEFNASKQLKHAESSAEASSCQMAARWRCHQRDIVAAHILVQMANEDSGSLCHGLDFDGVKHSMKGMLRMRWETRGDIRAGDNHSEVDRRKAKFLAKGQEAAVAGQMNDGDTVVLDLSAMACPGRRKHRKINIVKELSSLMNYTVNDDKNDYLYEGFGVLDGNELTNRWGNNDQNLIVADLKDPYDMLGVSKIKKRKRVAISCVSRETEDFQERLHHVRSLPAPPLVLMKPTSNNKERFKGMKRKMNITTISPSSKEVRAHFHKEEALRYAVPYRGFCYTALDSRKSAVAPLAKVNYNNSRYHAILKPDRPRHIYTLCLVRDAAARLPGGMGTRADICTLMCDSQYLAEDISDEQLNQVVSKGLDRLHYELDPCVRYNGKVWVYLHRDRGEDDFEDDATSSTYVRRRYR